MTLDLDQMIEEFCGQLPNEDELIHMDWMNEEDNIKLTKEEQKKMAQEDRQQKAKITNGVIQTEFEIPALQDFYNKHANMSTNQEDNLIHNLIITTQ